jgi:hypothetical protein
MFLFFSYYIYNNQYQKDIDKYIQNEISYYKQNIYTSNKIVIDKIKKQKEFYKSIHSDISKIVYKNSNIDLEKLKKRDKRQIFALTY